MIVAFEQTTESIALRAWAENRFIFIELSDGLIVGFPSNRFSRLKTATDAELSEVRVEVNGRALRWEKLDEDITVQGVVQGRF